MKTSRKIIGIIMSLILAGSMCACGSETGVDSKSAADESVVSQTNVETEGSEAGAAESVENSEVSEISDGSEGEDNTQNPIMNFVGPYACDRAVMNISAKDNDGAEITVTWSNSASSHAEWTMSGTFDTETMTINYSDCKKSVIEVNEDGETVSDETEYENGKGRIVIHEDNSVTWEDDEENAAEGMVFTFNFSPEE